MVRRLTLIAALGGLLFGYDTAVISGAISSINANFISPLRLSEAAGASALGLTVSSALVGCVIGGGIAGPLADRYGRKSALIIAATLFLVCSIGSAVPELGIGAVGRVGSRALLAFNIYRILGGVGVGVASLVSPLYIAEIASKQTRGSLVSLNQIAVVLGIVGVYFVNWTIAMQGNEGWLHEVGWRWMLASEAIPSAVFLILLNTIPDTPRWLIARGLRQQGLETLRNLGDANPGAAVAEIAASAGAHSRTLFYYGRRVIIVGIMLSVFQQFVGINAVMYYAPMMFKNMGATTDSALLQTTVVGAANLVFTILAVLTVDRVGRRSLLIAGAFVMAASMLALGMLFASRHVGVGALVALVAYVAAFACSWGPVTWVLLSEIFPTAIKGKAMSLAVATQWMANLLVSWSFSVIDSNSTLNGLFNHALAFWIYGVLAIVAATFVWRYVPETARWSLENMHDLWKHEGRPDKERVPHGTLTIDERPDV
jgi:MFS transporter, SP family, xylose:H+ symportor